MGEVFYVASVVLGVAALVTMPIFIILAIRRKNINKADESWIDDQQILQFFADEPDRMLSSAALTKKTGLPKSAVRAKLSQLQMNGVLMAYSTGLKAHYNLRKPLPELRLDLHDSKITVDDLITIFIHCDFHVNLADIIAITGLSLKEVLKEMKILKIEGVLTGISNTQGDRRYILNEPYKSEAAKIKSQGNSAETITKEATEPVLDLRLLEIALRHSGQISKEILRTNGYSKVEADEISNQLEANRSFEKVMINKEEVFELRK